MPCVHQCVSVSLQWTVRYDCFLAQPGSTVSVSVYSHSHLLISADHVIEHTGLACSGHNVQSLSRSLTHAVSDPGLTDPVPKASVTVDEHAKLFTVRLETDQKVRMSLCYKFSHAECVQITHVPEVSQRFHLSLSKLHSKRETHSH